MDMRKNVNFGFVSCYEHNNVFVMDILEYCMQYECVFPMSVMRFSFECIGVVCLLCYFDIDCLCMC